MSGRSTPESGQETQLLTGAFNPNWSPDGSHLAVDAAFGGAASHLDHRRQRPESPPGHQRQLRSRSAHELRGGHPMASDLVFRRIQQQKSDIVVVDVADGTTRWVTHDDVVDFNPAWSAIGTLHLFLLSARRWPQPLARPGLARRDCGIGAAAAHHRRGRRPRSFGVPGQQAARILESPVSRRTYGGFPLSLGAASRPALPKP